MSELEQLRVWKYEITGKVFQIEAPRFLRVLHVETQGVVPCFWALVRPAHPPVLHRFQVAATGDRLPPATPADAYVGTFLLHGGGPVYHLFYLGEAEETP